MTVEYSFDPGKFDFDAIHLWLSHSYWSQGISRARVEKGFRASTVIVGAFADGAQVGAARAVSDTTRFGYIADVFVREDYRGKGIAREMVRQIMKHPLVADVDSWYLLTMDAHPVYAGLGYKIFPHPDHLMICRKDGKTDPCQPLT